MAFGSLVRVALGVGGAATYAAACSSDLDCSLNGVCSKGVCVCDVPWNGSSCGVLSVEPAEPAALYGESPNVTSWGGNILAGDDGQFHLFVAEVPGGLSLWQHGSRCVHATSPNVTGPFQKADEVLGAECHNPAPIRDPRTGEYLLFHIGNGGLANSSGFMHHSSSPSGPWQPARTAPGSCNNPSPAFHPNGTLFVICGASITSAATWDGEWQPMRSLHKGELDLEAGQRRSWEDPNLWFDRRGNWHIVFHTYCTGPWPVYCLSGHAYSQDGFDWTFSSVEPYGGTVQFTDGSSFSFATRERPKFIFSDDRHTTPVALINGVSPQPAGEDCDSCVHGDCSSCKATAGRDWTYTLLQPLKGFAAAALAPTAARTVAV